MLLNHRQQIEAMAIIRMFLKVAWDNRLIDFEEVGHAKDWFNNVYQPSMSQLEQVELLNDGWDGDGSLRPSKDAILTTKRILLVLEKTDENPYVTPTENGGIQLDFEDRSQLYINDLGKVTEYSK